MTFSVLPRALFFGAGLLAAAFVPERAGAQSQVVIDSGPAASPDAPPAPLYSAAQLDQLLGPIALYPDPLIALMLPAATSPDEIVSAATYVSGQGDPSQIEHQPWSDSVKGLAHYSTVLEWMAQNLQWTQALGAAFANQPGDVMQSIQRLRSLALAAGTLVDTPQQHVVQEDGLIEILPAETDVIYVPAYDPGIVYVGGHYDGPCLTFGPPYPTGVWLTYGFDWRQRILWVGNGRFAHDSRGWRVPDSVGAGGHRWQPPANTLRAGTFMPRGSGSVVLPHSVPGNSPVRRPNSLSVPARDPATSAGVPAPRPRPSLPPEARGTLPPPSGYRPVNSTSGSSPMYNDMRSGLPLRSPTRPVIPAGTQARPSSASPSSPGRNDHPAERPAARPADSAHPPPADSKDSDSTKH